MKKILFLCMGNICRSPAAHHAMEDYLAKVEDLNWEVDSAGLISYHQGDLPDSRMRGHALKRGLKLTHRARQIRHPEDFEAFEYIFYMDDQNLQGLNRLDPEGEFAHKIFRLTDFCTKSNRDHVPDPYFGGPQGFEEVLDIVEDAVQGIYQKLLNPRG